MESLHVHSFLVEKLKIIVLSRDIFLIFLRFRLTPTTKTTKKNKVKTRFHQNKLLLFLRNSERNCSF